MSDGKYFATTKKGEIHELKGELNSLDRPKKKEAVKKVIAAMTVGKDVSMLFPDVVNCMQTDDLELKKLVYLYLINYAKTQPDLAIMAVNTFVKDSQDPNPLIRALAVRTMGCIRVDKITEYLCDPLQRCLKDDDPYVRKTAAVCVTKLFDINAELVEDRGFLDMLRDMLSDANPMVVANAIASLQEIQELSGKEVLQINSHTLFKLLAALNECTEWGQVFILDSLAAYDTTDPRDAEKIVERVLPRLQHVNSAVVLSAIKVIMKQMEIIGNDDMIKQWCKKMAPPLVTLLSAEPEVQYVALRNINLIVQKRPQILAHEVKVFFCKYNDPIYVKMEKLEIMIKLAGEKNVDQVLLEFKEYAQEVDVDFVRKAVRAIGRCAVALDKAAERCINVLLELIQTKVNYVVQEAIVVIKDIFRRYPNQYESIIATLCENLESLDEPEAKASMIWIIGEYAERIDNADELLETFLETFPEETSMVQLQLLTATVKLFLKKPTESAQKMISLVLSCATSETDNPDLRDRAYVYWRLLSTDAEAAKEVVLAEKPVITDDSNNLDPLLLDQLLAQLSTLASVYHKPADTFISRQRMAVQKVSDLTEQRTLLEEDEAAAGGAAAAAAAGEAPAAAAVSSAPIPEVDLLGGDLLDLGTAPPPPPAAAAAAAGLDDLLGGLSITPAAPAAPAAAISDDPFAMLSGPAATPAAPAAPAAPALPVLLPAERGKGLTVSGKMVRVAGQVHYSLAFVNNSTSPVDGLMVQFNNNCFGMVPTNQVVPVATIVPGASAQASVPIGYNAAKQSAAPATAKLQVALKTAQLGVFYWDDSIPLAAALEEGGTLEPAAYMGAWRAIAAEAKQQLNVSIGDVEAAKAKLAAGNVFVLAHRPVPNTPLQAFYVTCKAQGVAQLLMELSFTPGTPGVDATVKSERPDLAPMVFECLSSLLA